MIYSTNLPDEAEHATHKWWPALAILAITARIGLSVCRARLVLGLSVLARELDLQQREGKGIEAVREFALA